MSEADLKVMDTMCGKWKIDSAKTENFDNYAAAMELPEDLRKKIKEATNVTYTMKRDGDGFVAQSDMEGDDKPIHFKLGEEFKNDSCGIEVLNKFWVEGNASLGYHIFAIGEGEKMKTTSKRYLQDGNLIVESEGKGVTMKNVMTLMEKY